MLLQNAVCFFVHSFGHPTLRGETTNPARFLNSGRVRSELFRSSGAYDSVCFCFSQKYHSAGAGRDECCIATLVMSRLNEGNILVNYKLVNPSSQINSFFPIA